MGNANNRRLVGWVIVPQGIDHAGPSLSCCPSHLTSEAASDEVRGSVRGGTMCNYDFVRAVRLLLKRRPTDQASIHDHADAMDVRLDVLARALSGCLDEAV